MDVVCDEGEMEKNLANLPSHVLNLVVERLCFLDLFRFGWVCKPWRTCCDPVQFQNHLPWLIVPFINTKSFSMSYEDTGIIGFYSIYEEKLYKEKLPEISNRRICGSFPGGWLMTVHANSEVQLFNPLTTSTSLINLPPLTSFPRVHPEIVLKRSTEGGRPRLRFEGTETPHFSFPPTYMRDAFIHKVAASSSSITEGTIIVAIQSLSWSLAFYRIGEQHIWTSATPKHRGAAFWDLTYYKGKFYAVHHDGSVFVFDGLEVATPSDSFLYDEKVLSPPPGGKAEHYYILESSGELLVVRRHIEVPLGPGTNTRKLFSTLVFPHKTVGFDVFKLDFGTPNNWVKVESLGDHSLFLGYNSSFSIPSHKVSGCKPSCIYFTDDNIRCRHAKKFGGYDCGIFNLQDGTIENFLSPGDNLLVMPPPIWFTHLSF